MQKQRPIPACFLIKAKQNRFLEISTSGVLNVHFLNVLHVPVTFPTWLGTESFVCARHCSVSAESGSAFRRLDLFR